MFQLTIRERWHGEMGTKWVRRDSRLQRPALLSKLIKDTKVNFTE